MFSCQHVTTYAICKVLLVIFYWKGLCQNNIKLKLFLHHGPGLDSVCCRLVGPGVDPAGSRPGLDAGSTGPCFAISNREETLEHFLYECAELQDEKKAESRTNAHCCYLVSEQSKTSKILVLCYYLNWRTRTIFENKLFIFISIFVILFEKKWLAECAALGGKYYSPANSRTNGRRGTSEAAIESSRCEDSYELLKCS